MILDDFVVLGKTVPEPTSDGRVFVCSAGYSRDIGGLIRVYPLARRQSPPRWSVCHLPLERNPKDPRPESYKIRGDRTPGGHDRINEQISVTGTLPTRDRAALLAKCTVGSIAEANERRLSLAVIHPQAYRLELWPNEDSPDSPQLVLFDPSPPAEIPAGAKRFPFIPRLRFSDPDPQQGGEHCLMLRDWGTFELMRHHPEYRHDQIRAALHLSPSSSLLIGNMNGHRNAWLVISVLNGLQAEVTPALFGATS